MDPALWELVERSSADEVEAVIRLDGPPPPSIRLVSSFGDVHTCRLRRADILAVRAAPGVRSLKASRTIARETFDAPEPGAGARPTSVGLPTGLGVVVAVIDWGCDFAHEAFRMPSGKTRLRALWDQRSDDGDGPAPWGYGRVFSREEIDAALAAEEPYATLGYHPGDSDTLGVGTHGTHVLDLAAGSVRGVAPEAELAFVHLGRRGESDDGLASSATLLEALDFVDRIAGEEPLVVNLSLGQCAGPHDGTTLVELAIESFVTRRAGRMVFHSAGNYYVAGTHAAGSFAAGPLTLEFDVPRGDPTANELDVWYRSRDEARFRLWTPAGVQVADAALDDRIKLNVEGKEIGRAYHRRADPNNGEHNFHVFLDVHPLCDGRWKLEIAPVRTVDGDFDAYLERDRAPQGQARFTLACAVPSRTTGTICHARTPLTVGAADGRAPAFFTSEGPTRDGRCKPELCARGVRVRGARSAAPGERRPSNDTVEKSGTSMAAPKVAGAAALLLERDPSLSAAQLRELILAAVDPLEDPRDAARLGAGYLNIEAAVRLLDRGVKEDAMTENIDARIESPGEDTQERLPYLEEFEAPAWTRPPDHRLPPAWMLFDAARGGGAIPGGLQLIGAPGTRPRVRTQPGDVMVVRALGERNLARVFRVEELRPDGSAVVIARGNGGTTTLRPLMDGTRMRLDSALFRLREDWTETGPAFEVGHLVPARTWVQMPITFEDAVGGASGIVIRQVRCETRAQIDASPPFAIFPIATEGDPILIMRTTALIDSLAPPNVLWRFDGAGQIESSFDAVIYYPANAAGSADLASGGPFPLAVICMGNHNAFSTITFPPTGVPVGTAADGRTIVEIAGVTFGTEILSHHGYSAVSRRWPPPTSAGPTIEYLQEALARRGIISISVSTNPANVLDLKVETRADLVLKALAHMRTLHYTPGPFHGKVDLSRVAFVGHSRGGDAVTRAMLKSRSANVRALVQLAPTDIIGQANGTRPSGAVPPRTTFVTSPMRISSDLDVMYLAIYGSRDGDVSGIQDQRLPRTFGTAFRHYDRASAQRAFQFWHGATHNRFNRFWEDAGEGSLVGPTATLLPRPEQEARTVEAVGGWLGWVLNHENAERDRFDGRTATAVATSFPVVSMWKFGRALKTIDRFDDDQRADRNTLGGHNIPPRSGLIDEVVLANENPPGAGETNFQFMHIDPVLRASLPGSGGVSAGAWRAEIPSTEGDFSRFTLLTLRVTKKYDELQVGAAVSPFDVTALLPGVRVRLRDGGGTEVARPAASSSGRSFLPDIRHLTGGRDLTKYHFETWEVRLSDFAGIDLHHVTAVDVEMSGPAGQPIYVDTISLVQL